jgi:hypothetical protein
MSQDLYPVGTRHCFACIQWDGRRTYEKEKALIKTDAASEGRCRLKHQDVKGSSYCEQYYPLR